MTADLYDGIYNRFFLGGVFNKAYPENVLQGLQAHLTWGPSLLFYHPSSRRTDCHSLQVVPFV